MLDYIVLENFKCFENEGIRLSPLTFITGINGIGKSTLIQALLVLRQSFINRYLIENQISLKDDLTNLVNGDSVLYNQAVNNSFSIQLESMGRNYSFIVENVDGNSYLQSVKINSDADWSKNNLFSEDFVYLNAERLSPQESYKPLISTSKNFSRLGNIHGDKTVGILFDAMNNMTTLNIRALKFGGMDNEKYDTIWQNVMLWMSYIMGTDIKIKIEKISGNDLRLSYAQGRESVFYSPVNVAFGNSYLLPIVVAILTANVGGLILLENPEVHLHPAAQFRLGRFLALAAQQDIQIIVETHSDHLLNGVRVSTKKREFDSLNLSIQYFVSESDEHFAQVIKMDEEGQMDHWPVGFFDEWEKALDKLNEL